MHPTGRPLDAEFESNTAPGTLLPGDGTEAVIQDFNAFFEKLSGLDDVRWGDDAPSPGPSATTVQPDVASQAPQAEEAKPASSKAPPAQLAPAAPAGGRAPAQAVPPAHLAPPAPGRKPEPHRVPATPSTAPGAAHKRGLPLGFKLAMMALALFAIGMGVGWLALSLPKTPARGLLAENPLIPLDTAEKAEASANSAPIAKSTPLPNPWDAPKPATATKDVLPLAQSPMAAPAAKVLAVAPAVPVAPKTPAAPSHTAGAAPVDDGVPDAFSEQEPAVPKVPAPQTVTVELPASPLFAQAAPVLEAGPLPSAPSAPQAPTAPPSAQPRATPPGPAVQAGAHAPSGGYAVQVGACSSARCVENYRKLVQPHVGPHPVQVVRQAAANGAAVQRVRVEPLTREQALNLKQALEQADPRLKNAYVVKLVERS
jgi:hypothetical protein